MSLLDLQRKTLHAVQRPLNNNYNMKSRDEKGNSVAKEAESFIKPNDRLSSFERLEIYNRQYWFRLLSAMAEDFPGLAALLGDREFERLSVAYLTERPSRSFTLRNLGHALEEWLHTYQRDLPVDKKILLDIARIEWAHVEAFDNAALPPLSLAAIGALGENTRLQLQPYVRLLTLNYPVDNFVVSVHRAQEEAGMASNAVTRPRTQRKRHLKALQPEKIFLAVHRHNEFVYYKRLGADAFTILTHIEQGSTLDEALSSAAAQTSSDEQTFAQNIQAWFTNWGELGWLSDRKEKAH